MQDSKFSIYAIVNCRQDEGEKQKSQALSVQLQSIIFLFQDLDIVASECKPSTNYLTSAEPSKTLQPKQSSNASILNLQLLPVLPKVFDIIKLLPKCFRTHRNTVSHTQINGLI
jgi:hypothetical protein